MSNFQPPSEETPKFFQSIPFQLYNLTYVAPSTATAPPPSAIKTESLPGLTPLFGRSKLSIAQSQWTEVMPKSQNLAGKSRPKKVASTSQKKKGPAKQQKPAYSIAYVPLSTKKVSSEVVQQTTTTTTNPQQRSSVVQPPTTMVPQKLNGGNVVQTGPIDLQPKMSVSQPILQEKTRLTEPNLQQKTTVSQSNLQGTTSVSQSAEALARTSFTVEDAVTQATYVVRRRQKMTGDEKYVKIKAGVAHCRLCHIQCGDVYNLELHLGSKRHVNKFKQKMDEGRLDKIMTTGNIGKKDFLLAQIGRKSKSNGHKTDKQRTEQDPANNKYVELINGVYLCKLCDVRCTGWSNMSEHLSGRLHATELKTGIMKKNEASSSSSSNANTKEDEKQKREKNVNDNRPSTTKERDVSKHTKRSHSSTYSKPITPKTTSVKNAQSASSPSKNKKTHRTFSCEICNVRAVPFSQEAVDEHVNAKGHTFMRVFWENGLWPGSGENCNPKVARCEPQIYKFLDTAGTVHCEMCNEAILDGYALYVHQQTPEHYRKLIQNGYLSKIPVIYVCEAINRCPFRHCLTALQSPTTCQIWESGSVCRRMDCTERHSNYKTPSAIMASASSIVQQQLNNELAESILNTCQTDDDVSVESSKNEKLSKGKIDESCSTAESFVKQTKKIELISSKSQNNESSETTTNEKCLKRKIDYKDYRAATETLTKRNKNDDVVSSKSKSTEAESRPNIVDLVKNLKPTNVTPEYSKSTVEKNLPTETKDQNSSINLLLEILLPFVGSPSSGRGSSDSGVDAILNLLLQNELNGSDSDPVCIVLLRKVMQMRSERKEQENRLAQFVSLIPALAAQSAVTVAPPPPPQPNNNNLLAVLSTLLCQNTSAFDIQLPQKIEQPVIKDPFETLTEMFINRLTAVHKDEESESDYVQANSVVSRTTLSDDDEVAADRKLKHSSSTIEDAAGSSRPNSAELVLISSDDEFVPLSPTASV